MAVPVDIFLVDDSVSPAPIAGAVVGVLDSTTSVPVAQGVTDSAGKASLMLPGSTGGLSYELRFFKLGAIFKNPQSISVLEPVNAPQTNAFDFSGTLVGGLPSATDSRLCRCTGRFMTFGNQPLSGALVRVSAKGDSGFQQPLIVDGNLVAPDSMEFHTDDYGYLTIDLMRAGAYTVSIAGDSDNTWDIAVPDRSSVNLIELIHPAPVTLVWDPTIVSGNAVTVAVGGSLGIPFTIIFSDYEIATTGLLSWVTFTSADSDISSLGIGDGILTVEGRSVGVTTVDGANLPGLAPFRIPDYATTIPTLTVTVTS